jgi:hypothetical protein
VASVARRMASSEKTHTDDCRQSKRFKRASGLRLWLAISAQPESWRMLDGQVEVERILMTGR